VALKRKLGRGLGEILGSSRDVEAKSILEVETSKIVPNREQPRQDFNPEKMESLMDSIAKNGMLQPIIVRSTESGYEIIAGERRWKAAMQLGLEKIPVIIKEVSDEKLLELAIIENIQREDLNPIERAKAYKKLMEDFHLTQEQAAAALGLERSTLANSIRLLELDESIQQEIAKGVLTAGHAKVLLSLQDKADRLKLAKRIMADDLSVRTTEEIAGSYGKKTVKKTKAPSSRPPHIRSFEDRLRRMLGTKVTIKEASGRGKIIIEFYSNDDFDRILDSIGQSSG
jgi:ParB family chromosome partitioning protein